MNQTSASAVADAEMEPLSRPRVPVRALVDHMDHATKSDQLTDMWNADYDRYDNLDMVRYQIIAAHVSCGQ